MNRSVLDDSPEERVDQLDKVVRRELEEDRTTDKTYTVLVRILGLIETQWKRKQRNSIPGFISQPANALQDPDNDD